MSVAANRYAKALLDVLYPQKADTGLKQLQEFVALLKEQPDARTLLANPTVSSDRRKRLVNEIAGALCFDKTVANFINILIDRNRLPLIDEIIASYQRLLDERLGVVRAFVRGAQALDPSQQEQLVAKLETVTGKQVRMEFSVDPSLIGGVVAQVGSTIYDGSVRQQLKAFKSRLIEE
jgi:F-type H+-transporting ATPase subunit delta